MPHPLSQGPPPPKYRPDLRLAFPHYGDYRIYGAVAAIEIDRGVDRYAYQRGLWVIKQTGDTVTLANDAGGLSARDPL